MPFYEYQCTNCDHRLEVLQKISDEPLDCCPECNQSTLKKLISAAAFRLKGTGWYETDFKNSGSKKESDKTSDSKAGESKSTSGDKKQTKKTAGTEKKSAKSGNAESASA